MISAGWRHCNGILLLLCLTSSSRVINQCDLFYVLPAVVSRTLAPTRALPQAVMRAWKRIAFAKTLTRHSIIPCCGTRPIWGHTIFDDSCDADGTFGAVHARVCDLATKTLASTRTRALQGMRDGRSGFGEVTNRTVCTIEVVRSAVSFWTGGLIRQLSCVLTNIPTPSALFQAAAGLNASVVINSVLVRGR